MDVFFGQAAGFGWMAVTVSIAKIGVISIVFSSAVHPAVMVHSLFGSLRVAPIGSYENCSR